MNIQTVIVLNYLNYPMSIELIDWAKWKWVRLKFEIVFGPRDQTTSQFQIDDQIKVKYVRDSHLGFLFVDWNIIGYTLKNELSTRHYSQTNTFASCGQKFFNNFSIDLPCLYMEKKRK